MNRIAATMVLILTLAVFGVTGAAHAEDGDVSVDVPVSLAVGEPFIIRFEVRTAETAKVTLDAGNASWGSFEVLREVSHDIDISGVGALHRFEVLLAPFEFGLVAVAPSVTVTGSDEDTSRTLAPVSVVVASTLPAEAPLELSPLSSPGVADGRQSPWLVPWLIGGSIVGAVAAIATIALLARGLRRAWRLPESELNPAEEVAEAIPLDRAEGLLDDDPVGAYRVIGRAVRRALSEAYALPVASMTTDELHHRLEPGGVDSWVVRMATDLLEQCDAVVYAGYRPASERRRGDLAVAGEILRVAD